MKITKYQINQFFLRMIIKKINYTSFDLLLQQYPDNINMTIIVSVNAIIPKIDSVVCEYVICIVEFRKNVF
jgi:hypothetical protein